MSDYINRSFAGGEIAPALYGRADLIKYQTGLRRCRNFQIQRHGGAANRAGLRFRAATKDSSKISRSISFIFSETQAYALEFGDGYIRFFKGGAQITIDNSDAPAWSNATNYVIGDLVTQAGTRYYAIAASLNQIPPNASFWYPLTGDIYEIPTSYAELDLFGLKWAQSADVMTITHPSYESMDLSRFDDVRWTLSATPFAPVQGAPGAGAATNGTAGTVVWRYRVTAVAPESFEESLPNAIFTCTGGIPTFANPNALSWSAASPVPLEYNVYKEVVPGNGVYGYIGTATATSFNDVNIIADASTTPPMTRNPVTGSDNRAGAVGYYQQRRVFGGSNNDPETTHTSKSGKFTNFTVSSPLRDDDAVSFTLAGKRVNRIRAYVDLKDLVILTESAEYSVTGDANGVLRPGGINAKPQSYYGCHPTILPVTVGNSVLFIQARGTIVRDLAFDIQTEGYKGNDLTLYAAHLFEKNHLVDWDYAQSPNSIVWAVRDDGIMLGLTYVRDQAVWGWHRHDTKDGDFESVCVVPEGQEDTLYCIVRRTLPDGSTVRYVETLETRVVSDLEEDAYFVDSGLSYNGWNGTPITLELTGGVSWTDQEDLNLESSDPLFDAGEVGNAYVLRIPDQFDEDGTLLEEEQLLTLNVVAFIDPENVTVRATKTVPAEFRNTPFENWGRAVDSIGGLDHLEGFSLAVLGDGNVVADGEEEPFYTVTGGAITLDRCYVVIHAGLQIVAELETLDIDVAEQKTMLNKTEIIKSVDILVESSRGLLAGSNYGSLQELKQRQDEDYAEATELKTGVVSVACDSTYGVGGRVVIRQKDPLPLTVLAVMPSGSMKGIR